jgi:hypothetical protein
MERTTTTGQTKDIIYIYTLRCLTFLTHLLIDIQDTPYIKHMNSGFVQWKVRLCTLAYVTMGLGYSNSVVLLVRIFLTYFIDLSLKSNFDFITFVGFTEFSLTNVT